MSGHDLTADEIGALARQMHGAEHGAIRALSERSGIQYDTLRKAASGSRRLGPHHTALLRSLIAEQAARPPVTVMASIARPPASLHPGADRDEPCGETIDAAMDRLAHAALEAGWHPAEVASAVLGWVTHYLADGAGPDAARAMLAQAVDVISLRGDAS